MYDRELFFDAPAFEITKTYRDDNGQMFVEGIASTVDIDLTDERMSPEAIAKMATRAIGIPLRSEHGKGWDDKLGEIVQADVIKDDQGRPALWIKARLFDWSSKAKDLFGLLKSGAKMGLSVAGKIRPGGLVKELSESLGKYIPTYKDVDLTEVSVTDHPANLGTWAVAVAKSFTEQTNTPTNGSAWTGSGEYTSAATGEYAKDVTNAHESKPKEYGDVPSGEFLDEDNYKYPVDDKHLMPALRYFNQSGQREDGGYSPEQWATMGKKLAAKLSAKTGETYEYDEKSQTVTKPTTEKHTREEVNDMNKQDTNLVSKQVSPSVASFAKEWGRDLSKEITVEKAEGEEEAEKAAASTDTSTTTTPSSVEMAAPTTTSETTGDNSTTTATDKHVSVSVSPSSSESDSDETSTGSLESLLSDIMSSLSTLSSGSTSSSSDDSTSTDSSSTGSSDSSDGSSSYDDVVTSLSRALESLKALNKAKATPAATPTAKPTATPSTTTTPTTGVTELGKAMLTLTDAVTEIKKSVDGLVEKVESVPQPRKGYAVLLEKSFNGHTSVQEADAKMEETLKNDPEVDHRAFHIYRTTGELPAKYQNAQN